MSENKIKISIVVPVYNVERYLEQCLDSLINQTLKDIEIICVNDGSTDDSLCILKRYAEVDDRILIVSKVNSGYGHTMNTGMAMAKGEYLAIVESDDFVVPEMFEKLYDAAISNDLDIARGHFYYYNSKENKKNKADLSWVQTNKVFSPLEDFSPFYQPPSIWAAIFRVSLLKKENIRFLETPGASFQDTSFAFKAYACANRFMMLDEAFLFYRIDNEASSINSTAKVFCVCDEYDEIIKFVSKKNLHQKLGSLVPKLQYGTYKWNYERLPMPQRYSFLKKWSKELRGFILTGQIAKGLYTKKELKRIYTIAFFPWIYKNRGNL